jgi:hypothetical protein
MGHSLRTVIVPPDEDNIFSVELPVSLSDNGTALMKFAACNVSVSDDDGGARGSVGSCVGGTMQVMVFKDGKTYDYRIRPQDMWNAVCKQHALTFDTDMSDYIEDTPVENV